MNSFDYWKKCWDDVVDHGKVSCFQSALSLKNEINEIDELYELTKNFVKDAMDVWFPAAVKPRNILIVNDLTDANGTTTGGSTIPFKGSETMKIREYSDIKLNRSVVGHSPFVLFYTLGHELIHVSQWNAMAGEEMPKDNLVKADLYWIMDYFAYQFEYDLKQKQYIPDEEETAKFSILNDKYASWILKLDWKNFPWTAWQVGENNNSAYPQSTRYKYPL